MKSKQTLPDPLLNSGITIDHSGIHVNIYEHVTDTHAHISDLSLLVLYSFEKGIGGYPTYFLTGCAARGLKPLPISKDFSPKKIADLTVFSKFSQIGTHF